MKFKTSKLVLSEEFNIMLAGRLKGVVDVEKIYDEDSGDYKGKIVSLDFANLTILNNFIDKQIIQKMQEITGVEKGDYAMRTILAIPHQWFSKNFKLL